jgi:hypothetical protein
MCDAQSDSRYRVGESQKDVEKIADPHGQPKPALFEVVPAVYGGVQGQMIANEGAIHATGPNHQRPKAHDENTGHEWQATILSHRRSNNVGENARGAQAWTRDHLITPRCVLFPGRICRFLQGKQIFDNLNSDAKKWLS